MYLVHDPHNKYKSYIDNVLYMPLCLQIDSQSLGPVLYPGIGWVVHIIGLQLGYTGKGSIQVCGLCCELC